MMRKAATSFGDIDPLGETGQGGTKSIMQMATQPAALFLPG